MNVMDLFGVLCPEPSWRPWQTFVRATYGLPMDALDIETFTRCHPIGTVRAYTPHGPEHITLHEEAADTTAVRPSSRRPTAAKENA